MKGIIIPKARFAIESTSFFRPDWIVARKRDPALLWLDKNENSDPNYLKIVKQVYMEILERNLSSYPENVSLYHQLAKRLDVAPENLLFSAGSDGAIRAAFEAYIEPDDCVIYTHPTFAMYSVYVQMYGAKAVPIEYEPSFEGPKLSLEKLIKAIRNTNPKMVCLPNPDSPTGTVIFQDDLKQIIEEAGKVGALMLIDEAYYPFYSQTVLAWTKVYPHLLVTRSTGKAWGMAGFRLGYAVASDKIILALQKVRSMYETNTIAFAVMERMLDFENEMLASVDRLEEGKRYFLNEMQRLNFNTLKGYGNFLHVNFGSKGAAVHAALKDFVYYRLDFNEACLKGYSRFSSTTVELFRPIVERIKHAII